MKFLHWKRIVAILLAVVVVICGSGCQVRPEPERFDAYLDELFRQMMATDTLTLHYFVKNPETYGITPGEVTFGVVEDTTLEDTGMTWAEAVDSQIQSLEFMFKYDKLTDSQKQIYDQLMYYFEVSRLFDGLQYYNEYCLGSNSVVTNLPLLLAEFEFRSQEDVETYCSLLSDYGTYFAEIAAYEKKKSEKGLFMSDASLDHFQANCQSLLESGEDNVLLISFSDRIEALEGMDEATKESYIKRNASLVEKVVMPAYKTLSEEMEKLRSTGTNDGGICNLPEGKQYYEFLAANKVGSDKTVDEMYTALTETMTAYQTKLQELLTEDPELEQKMTDFSVDVDTADPYAVLEYLEEAVKEDYPEIPEVNYTVKSISEYLSDTNVAAFYIISPIDDMTNHTIYTNDSRYVDGMQMFTTLSHEGFPGHLYQTVYFSVSQPKPMQYVLRTQGYLEGWASYVESQIYNYCGIEDENLALALQLNYAINLLLNASLDIAVNYNGMSLEDFTAMLQESMGTDEETCKTAYQALIEDPAVYLPYAVGLLEFTQLRETAEDTLGEDFNLKEFHKTVLDAGPIPFPMLKEYVEAWLAEETAAAQAEAA